MNIHEEITLEELKKYHRLANYAKKVIWHELVNELKLQPPISGIALRYFAQDWTIVAKECSFVLKTSVC